MRSRVLRNVAEAERVLKVSRRADPLEQRPAGEQFAQPLDGGRDPFVGSEGGDGGIQRGDVCLESFEAERGGKLQRL